MMTKLVYLRIYGSLTAKFPYPAPLERGGDREIEREDDIMGFTYDEFIKKYADAEREARRKLVDKLLNSDNSFMYVEDLSSGQNGWTLGLRDRNEFWLEWLYRVNIVD